MVKKTKNQNSVSSTEFQTRAGLYIEKAGKSPVFITKHNRPVRVLMDIDEYERLKARDTRQAITPSDLTDSELNHMMSNPPRDTRKAYYAWELPEECVEALKNSTYDHIDPELDKLME